ncbi:MAG: tetratricopeptide repeat protein [bacterium]|nr:tetratricopeptide repeat protein [bacterium]
MGDEHPDLVISISNLGGLFERMENYDAAEQCYREALAISRELLGNEHPNVAIGMNDLANLLEKKGHYSAAEALIRDALEILRMTFPRNPNHWRIINAESVLGACLSGLGHHAEAETILLRTYPILKKEKGARSFYANDALQRIVDLYEAWDRPQEAAIYRGLLVAPGPPA